MKKQTCLILAALAAFSFCTLTASAQTVAPASVSPGFMSILTGENFTVLFGFVAALLAIWKHRAANDATAQLSTAQKINQSLIIGIEIAGHIPEVAAGIAKLKSVVQSKATEYGVQPILHALVQTFTDSAATATATPSK